MIACEEQGNAAITEEPASDQHSKRPCPFGALNSTMSSVMNGSFPSC
jgi:hypothetical protein